MRERPILFSAPMVRAILEGRKTQTRRIVKPQPPSVELVRAKAGDGYHLSDLGAPGMWRVMGPVWAVRDLMQGDPVDARAQADVGPQWRCPYGAAGDRLWVRETWAELGAVSPATDEPLDIGPGERLVEPPTFRLEQDGRKRWRYDGKVVAYRANSDIEFCDGDGFGGDTANRADMPRWRPSIFMPRWASRIELEVTGVRVERLHAITDDDAKAEGVEPYTPPHGHISPDQRVPGPGFDDARLGDQPHRLPYADLWCTINGAKSWDANPWVWVVEFRRVEAQERAA